MDANYGSRQLRSTQIERLLGATRLGVRAMLATLGDSGVLERTTHGGVHLYAVKPGTRPAAPDRDGPSTDLAFSSAALDAYDASLADIDALLARSSGSLDEDWDAP
jgi:hypothetical protein